MTTAVAEFSKTAPKNSLAGRPHIQNSHKIICLLLMPDDILWNALFGEEFSANI